MAVSAQPGASPRARNGTGTADDDRRNATAPARSVRWQDVRRAVADRASRREPPQRLDAAELALGPLERPADLHGDRRGFILRRCLLVADVLALSAAMAIVELFGGLHH